MQRNNSNSLMTASNKIGDKNNISLKRKYLSKATGMHWHDFYEIELILSGKGTHILNGEEHPFKRGSVYMLSPLDFHQLKPDGEIELYTIIFRESVLSREFILTLLETGNIILYFDENEFEKISSLCNILELEYSTNTRYKEDFLKSILEGLLILILRKIESTSNEKANHKNDCINTAVLYIHQHFRENPSLTQTANEVHLNPKYLSQKFKITTGKNYNEYLTELKVSYAKKLLFSSNMSVTEICFASGFTSLSNFMKAFKKSTGFSPLKYIKFVNH